MPANVTYKMNVAPSYGHSGNGRQAYEYEVALATNTSSGAIMIPQDVENISCSFIVGAGGQGTIDVTNDTEYTVKEGTVTWIPSNAVAFVANTLVVLKPCTAIRLTQSTAPVSNTTLKVRAQ